MKPDLELREFIATKLMGVRVRYQRHKPTRSDLMIPGGVDQLDWYDPKRQLTVRDLIRAVPAYELDIAAAFQAVEAMRKRGYRFSVVWWPHEDEDTNCTAEFLRWDEAGDPEGGEAHHRHPPTAIALAIRAALESENQ